MPSYDTLDDIYIAGTNEQVDEVNKPHLELKAGAKVICQITCKDLDKNKVPNGKIGIVVKNEPRDFQVKWDDDTISKFKGSGALKVNKGKSRFKPAAAITIHKCQGKTLKQSVVISPSRLFERNHLYVAVTRATCLNNIFLTEPITFSGFCRTVFVLNESKVKQVEVKSPNIRLERMATHYKKEEPRLTLNKLADMRVKQNNQCCYCKIPMADTHGYDESITLERISNDKPHTLDNIKLACSKCNSLGVGQR